MVGWLSMESIHLGFFLFLLFDKIVQSSAHIDVVEMCSCLGVLIFLPRVVVKVDALIIIVVEVLIILVSLLIILELVRTVLLLVHSSIGLIGVEIFFVIRYFRKVLSIAANICMYSSLHLDQVNNKTSG